MKIGLKILVVYLTIFCAFFVYAATEVNTTMTWVVPSSVSHTLAYGGACSSSNFFFVETNCVFDSDIDGNGSKCLPYDAASAGSACQAAGTAGATVTNNGNVAFNLDGNFTAGFSGVDTNLVLKVWMGTGSGCGTSGLGGWAQDCTVTVATNPVTATTCRNYNVNNETSAGRLVSSLAASDTNQLCFSGDFNAGFGNGVSQGSHAVTYQTTSIAS
ncbi:MAG TPA: hypothetical protein VFF13_03160 [archaeon]|nr:hypothetical protein [archaeon]